MVQNPKSPKNVDNLKFDRQFGIGNIICHDPTASNIPRCMLLRPKVTKAVWHCSYRKYVLYPDLNIEGAQMQ